MRDRDFERRAGDPLGEEQTTGAYAKRLLPRGGRLMEQIVLPPGEEQVVEEGELVKKSEATILYYVAVGYERGEGMAAGFYDAPGEIRTQEDVEQMIECLSEQLEERVVPVIWKRLD